MPTHQLHEAYAIGVANGLNVRGIDRLHGLRARGVEAEGLVEHGHVVVDRLRHADHSALMADRCHGIEALHGAFVGAVSSQHEVLPDVHLCHDLGDLGVGRVAAVAHEDAPALHVDVLHVLLRELDPLGLVHAPLEASDDAIHLLDAVRVQHLHNLANHVVQARAEATASHNCSRRLARVEVDLPLRPTSLHLQVHAWNIIAAVLAMEGLRGPTLRHHDVGSQAVQGGVVNVLARKRVLQHHALKPLDLGTRPEQLLERHEPGVGAHELLVVLVRGVCEAVRLEVGLPCGEAHASKPPAAAVDPLLHSADHLHGQVAIPLVDLGRGDASKSCHGSMHGMLCQRTAVDAVVRVRLDRAHHVGRVEILDGQRSALGLEAILDLVLQPRAHVSIRWALTGVPEQRCPATIRDNHNRVSLAAHHGLAVGQHLLQGELHLGDQADVHVA
mmetsp:Transcript_94249/g.211295  ORF Transcript_94249/g.211295 Transcript_94249/m.211295 type:complete len:444 (+) Transcript_94249:396-1727(+)